MSMLDGQIVQEKAIKPEPAEVKPLRPPESLVRRQRLIVSLFRWCLPLVLFIIVFLYEATEHIATKGQPWGDIHFTSEILFFGILGPLAVFGVLSYLQRLLRVQWETQAALDHLNRGLQRKVAERTAELQASNAELRQLDEMKSEFVALVSHELRAPLTTLQGGLELALQQADSLAPGTRHTLEVMRAESHRLTSFIQRILDLSRLEARRLPLVVGPVALRPLLRRSVAVVVSDARPLEWDLPSDLPLLLGDETHLEEAIRNVLSNAHKYAPTGTPIHIRVRRAENCLDLSIIDHGPGIPADTQARIFDRFYRGAGNGELQSSAGWGLGLYLARRLVEAQGGRLSVRSPVWPDEDAPGAAFTFTLPLDLAEELGGAGDNAD